MKKETRTNFESVIIIVACFIALALLQDDYFR
ncbi:hypothetical protein UFOVP617_31 [uncultured Caudovirales phage]|uniref:Uncharacterized protein n=1 Tax=uncultured Caudovirales phage TaxID=2100421 RepID=A0A6J5N6B4_9CAUD|nr:hypothetical protein UFOVP617_31 [uncultured Caudovirales phage]